MTVIINGDWFTLYLPEDGRIVVQVSGSFKVYQADENNRITHEKFEELVKKYNQISNLEESETTEQTNRTESITFRVNDSLPKYNATVTYNQENPQLAETLII